MTLFALSPYRKTIVAAVISIVGLVGQFIQQGTDASLIAALTGIVTTLGVFKTTNKAAPSPVTPSAHTVTVRPTSVTNVAAIAARDRKKSPKKVSSKVSKKSPKKGE